MIWRPRPRQRVRIRYGKGYARAMPFHNRVGTVQLVAATARLVNALVLLDGGEAVVVPRGNLFEEK